MLELINSLGWTIGAFIFVLGIMIFIHELGHYLMAKYLGIRVEVFSLGFGPRLFGFRKGETDYRVSLLPLGGYVKMSGEHYDENLTGSPDEFLSRPKSHRFAVAIAGPLMNLGLAVALLSVNYMMGVNVPEYLSQPAVIGHIRPDSPAQEAGLQMGDTIVAINQTRTPSWQDVELAVATSPNQTLLLTVQRGDEVLRKEVTVGEAAGSGVGTIGISPPVLNVVTSVEPGSPAAEAGLRAGDAILEVFTGAQAARELNQILALITAHEGTPLTFRIRRDQQVLEKTITPVEMEGRTRIGIGIGETIDSPLRLEKYGLFQALGKSLRSNYQMTVLTFQVVGKLLTGQASLRMMSGPIEIAKYSGQAASLGAAQLMAFMAMVSLQLGLLNLFPIPVLDGGIIALLAVEAVLGRDISLKVKERILQAGFIFLVLLMGIVIFNDIAKNL